MYVQEQLAHSIASATDRGFYLNDLIERIQIVQYSILSFQFQTLPAYKIQTPAFV